MLCRLLNVKSPEAILSSHYKGALFENMVIAEYIKNSEHHYLFHDFCFWRDAEGHEVDLIWQNDEQLNLVEIKAGKTLTTEMFKGLSYFENLMPQTVKSKTLIYGGM